jgi:hypothetical protein
MEKKEISLHIDFKDSSFRSCEIKDDKLIIYLNSWNDKTLKLVFLELVQVIYKSGDFIEGVYEKLNKTELDEILQRYCGKTPEQHEFKIFQILDIYDFPLFEIVAKEMKVIKE